MFISKFVTSALLALTVSGFSTAALAQQQPQPHVRHVPKRLVRFDANHDGVLQASEVPPRLRAWFAAVDANKDGIVTAREIRKYNRAHRHPHHAEPLPKDI